MRWSAEEISTLVLGDEVVSVPTEFPVRVHRDHHVTDIGVHLLSKGESIKNFTAVSRVYTDTGSYQTSSTCTVHLHKRYSHKCAIVHIYTR